MIELSYFFAFICVLVACIRILHMNSKAEWPELFANGTSLTETFSSSYFGTSSRNGTYEERTKLTDDSKAEGFVSQILKHAPIFSRPYNPPLIWGRSGHLQTIIHSTLSRHKAPREKGDSRHAILLSDGTTVTFDLFLPPTELNQKETRTGQDITLVVCPGIGNSSETVALRTFSHHANEAGYRVAVLNHLGVIPTIPLTTSRIFNYGSTEEYGAMVDEVISIYPHTSLIAVGFSMGGNLICKYLGESAENRAKVIAGVSCCQGYDINRALGLLGTWKHMGKGYLRAINVCVQKILHNFQDVILTDENLSHYDLKGRDSVLKTRSLMKIDDIFLCKAAGFRDREEYYTQSSSSKYIPNIDIPMLFINSRDDPLVPTDLFDVPLGHTGVNDKALFVVTKHGGHLGFYECQDGSKFFNRGTFTWLDKAVVEYVKAVLLVMATAVAAKAENNGKSVATTSKKPGKHSGKAASGEETSSYMTCEATPVASKLSEDVIGVTDAVMTEEKEHIMGEKCSRESSGSSIQVVKVSTMAMSTSESDVGEEWEEPSEGEKWLESKDEGEEPCEGSVCLRKKATLSA